MDELILIVDDEPDLLRALAYSFEMEGFATVTAGTGAAALAAAHGSRAPDLILLDLMLPDLAGTEICRRLRADPATAHIPIIMVTARGEAVDRVVGFEVGADDYVVKPFLTRELVLRVRALLRRTQGGPNADALQSWGRLRINATAHRVWVDDAEVELTAQELRLLVALIERRGRVQSRDRLLDAVWDESYVVEPRTVDTVIRRLRHKLGPCADYVQTVRGVGYRFAVE